MSKNDNNVSVSATGAVIAPYDLVGFTITVSDTAETGPKARAKIKETSAEVLEFVDSLIRENRAEKKVVALTIDPEWTYTGNKKVPAGYSANMKVTFWTAMPETALQIQERLTEFPQSRVESLSFAFRDPEALREKALQMAWTAAKRRWKFQTDTLVPTGLFHGKQLALVSWNADYDEFQRISKVAAPSEGEAGSATISVTLHTTWGF